MPSSTRGRSRMVQRPCPDLRGGCAAMRIPTATEGRGAAMPPPTRPQKVSLRPSRGTGRRVGSERGTDLFPATVVILCLRPARPSRPRRTATMTWPGMRGSATPLLPGGKSRRGCLRIRPQVLCDLKQLTAPYINLVLAPIVFFGDLPIHHQ